MVRQTINSLMRGECTACTLMIIVAAFSSLYWTANIWINPNTLNDLVDGPLMIVSFVAGTYYLSWALFNCHKIVDRAFMLRLGICMAWLGNGVWRTSRFLYAQGIIRGPVGAHDPWRGYMIVIMTIAGVLHILAIDMEGGRPRRNKIFVSLLAVMSGFGFMLWLHRNSL